MPMLRIVHDAIGQTSLLTSDSVGPMRSMRFYRIIAAKTAYFVHLLFSLSY
jgi:hypothetical protein